MIRFVCLGKVAQHLYLLLCIGMKTVRIFSDRIRNRIRLEGLRSVHIRVRISNIRYRIRIRILKSHIYDVDIQSYPIRHSWHYPYSNPNPDRNMKTNVISVISVRIRSVFILTCVYNDKKQGTKMVGTQQKCERNDTTAVRCRRLVNRFLYGNQSVSC